METKLYEEIKFEVNNLNVNETMKQDLLYFNKKIQEMIESESNIDLIIDQTSRQNIEVLLEYVTDIIEKYGLYNEFIKYRDDTKVERIKNSVIVIDDFDIFKEEVLQGWNHKSKTNNFFMNAKLNNNMIIFTHSGKLEDNIKDINPMMFNPKLCIHLKGKNNTKELYNSLLNKYDERKIQYKLSYTTFKKIIDSLDNNNYVQQFNIDDYIYDYSIKKMIVDNNNIVNYKTFEDIIEKKDNEKNQKIMKSTI